MSIRFRQIPVTMTYCGDDERLVGKTALVIHEDGYVNAQFTDFATGMGHGWWAFLESDFQPAQAGFACGGTVEQRPIIRSKFVFGLLHPGPYSGGSLDA